MAEPQNHCQQGVISTRLQLNNGPCAPATTPPPVPCGTCAGMAASAAQTPQQTPPSTQHSSGVRQQHLPAHQSARSVLAAPQWWLMQHPCGSPQSRPADTAARSHLGQTGGQARGTGSVCGCAVSVRSPATEQRSFLKAHVSCGNTALDHQAVAPQIGA